MDVLTDTVGREGRQELDQELDGGEQLFVCLEERIVL